MAMLSGRSKVVFIVAGAYLITFFVLSSGVVNASIEGAGARSFIIPTRGVQSMGETVAITMILFIGFAGAFLLYRAGKVFATRTQNAFLAGGFGVIGIAMMLGYILVNVKV
ncbi:MAG: hypothetical protein QXJ74_04025 [Nitrososphaera sp.]|uniref:hypothetical protein n=1 Tax=Nitrososphaera sp. TaxID=1971748 RepID=UPI00182E78DB|nr:hypothetical protein [Nitrososphaera sp.]NWG36088.1 hypothetical protein [Nitrososphaera sp.]